MRPAWSWEAPDTLGPGRGQGGTEPRGQEKTPEGGAAGPAACKPVPTWESVPLGPPECSPGPCRVPLPPTRTGAWHTGPAVALPPFGEASASNCHPRRRKLSWGDEEGWAWWPGGLVAWRPHHVQPGPARPAEGHLQGPAVRPPGRQDLTACGGRVGSWAGRGGAARKAEKSRNAKFAGKLRPRGTDDGSQGGADVAPDTEA